MKQLFKLQRYIKLSGDQDSVIGEEVSEGIEGHSIEVEEE